MLYKVYDKVKTIIKNDYKFILLLIFIALFGLVKLPYYIDAPGGLINISNRIKIDNNYTIKGSLNFAYVSESQATAMTLLYAAINKDWDVFTKEEVTLSSEDIEDMNFRNRIMLQEANQTATILAYQKAHKELNITSTSLVVTYIDDFAETNLEVGDIILSVNGVKVNSKEELNKEKNKYKAGDTLKFKVKHDEEEIERTAKLIWQEDNAYVGVIISELKEFTTNPAISYEFRDSESGPSGGLMISLAIYSYLSKTDLTKGDIIVGTGTIDSAGNVGSIGGVEYKLKGAVNEKADLFIVPSGDNYKEALKIKKENNYDIKLFEAKTFDQVMEYLKNR